MAFIVPVNQPVMTAGPPSAIDGAGNFSSTTLIHAANWAIVRLVGSTVGQNAVWTLAGDNGLPVDFANGPLASMGQVLVAPGQRMVLTIVAATTFAVVDAQFVGLMSPSLEDLLPHYTPSPNPLGATVRGAVSVVGGEGNFTDVIVTGLTGAATQYRLVGAIANGPPTTGTFQTNDVVLEIGAQPRGWWICTVAGTPGTWVFDGLNANGFLFLPGRPGTQTVPAFPLDVSQDGVGVRTSTPSNAQFASAQFRMDLLAAALPNAGHEKWVFRTMRPGAGGVASNTRLQLYRANPAETNLQEYLRIDETTGVVHIADSTVVSAGAPSPGLSDVSVGDLAVTGLTGAVNASRYVGATGGGPPTAGTFAVGDLVVDRLWGILWTCITAGTPGTWRPSGPAIISDQTVSGATSVRLPASGSIPTYFRNLTLKYGNARSAGVANSVVLVLRANDDVGANYDDQLVEGSGAAGVFAANSSTTAARGGVIPAANSAAGLVGNGQIRCSQYALLKRQTFVYECDRNDLDLSNGVDFGKVNYHPGTAAAVAAITLSESGASISGTFTLYAD